MFLVSSCSLIFLLILSSCLLGLIGCFGFGFGFEFGFGFGFDFGFSFGFGFGFGFDFDFGLKNFLLVLVSSCL